MKVYFVGAGPGEVVLVASGSSARQTTATDKRPVDAVVMVIDAANGGEAQTRKVFEVCRRHRLPILIHHPVPEPALGRIGIVFKVALHPFEIRQPGAVGEFVDHAGRGAVGEVEGERKVRHG